MTQIRINSNVINQQVLSQNLAADLEKFMQTGGRVTQLATVAVTATTEPMCWKDAADRRQQLLTFITQNPRCTSLKAQRLLRVFHGHIAADLKLLVKRGLLVCHKSGNLFVYSARDGVQSCE